MARAKPSNELPSFSELMALFDQRRILFNDSPGGAVGAP
jgi:hypothetical protein